MTEHHDFHPDTGRYDSENSHTLTPEQVADLFYPGEGNDDHANALDKQLAAGKRVYSQDLRKAEVSTAQVVKAIRRRGGLVSSDFEVIEVPKGTLTAANDDDYGDTLPQNEAEQVEHLRKFFYSRRPEEIERGKTDPDGQRKDALRADHLRKVKRRAEAGSKALTYYGLPIPEGMAHDANLSVPDVSTGTSRFVDVQTWHELNTAASGDYQ